MSSHILYFFFGEFSPVTMTKTSALPRKADAILAEQATRMDIFRELPVRSFHREPHPPPPRSIPVLSLMAPSLWQSETAAEAQPAGSLTLRQQCAGLGLTVLPCTTLTTVLIHIQLVTSAYTNSASLRQQGAASGLAALSRAVLTVTTILGD